MNDILLEAKDLTKHFPVSKGLIFSKEIGAVKAVDGINFSITRGETFGLVGESGCGKTTTAKLILKLESITSGTLNFDGRDLGTMNKLETREYRGRVQPVFQDPYSSLSPRLRVGWIIGEPLVVNKTLPRSEIKARVEEIMEVVGLQKSQFNNFPHEFSGGQRQRIAVARAITMNPSLILLDEPVSALDVSIGAQIMNLLKTIQKELGLTYFLIAHDLAVVKHMSDRIGVMYLGKIVEIADADEMDQNPVHPYTKALYSAALPSHPDTVQEEIILPGEVPSPLNPPSGCRFHPRCSIAEKVCAIEQPELKTISPGHEAACHLA